MPGCPDEARARSGSDLGIGRSDLDLVRLDGLLGRAQSRAVVDHAAVLRVVHTRLLHLLRHADADGELDRG